jgi:hypothetical protein
LHHDFSLCIAQCVLDVEKHTEIEETDRESKQITKAHSTELVQKELFGKGDQQVDGGDQKCSKIILCLTLERFVVPVKKEDLVRRMVHHVRQCQQTGTAGEAGEESSLCVLRLLRHCLQLQRRALRLVEKTSYHAQHHSIKQARADWSQLQHDFTNYGVATVVVDVVASGRSHELVQAALQLGRTLALGGSTVVQEAVFAYLKATRSEAFFEEIARHIKEEVNRLNQTLPAAVSARGSRAGVGTARATAGLSAGSDSEDDEADDPPRKQLSEDGSASIIDKQGKHEEGGDDDDEDVERDDDGSGEPHERHSENHIKSIMQLLRHLCENHFTHMQHAVRDQSEQQVTSDNTRQSCGNHKTLNLVQSSVFLVECMAKKEQELDLLDQDDVQTLVYIFQFLIECAQGPCLENQEVLIASDLAECCKSIFTADFKLLHEQLGDRKGTMQMEKIQALAMKVLMSLIEGSHLHSEESDTGPSTQTAVQKLLEDKLEMSLLRQRLIKSHQKLLKMYKVEQKAKTVKHLSNAEQKREERLLGEVRDMMALVEQLSVHSESMRKGMTPLWKQKLSRNTADARAVGGGGQRTMGGYESEQQVDQKTKVEQEAYSNAHLFFYSHLEQIEIVWMGHLERLLFVKPRLCDTHTQFDKDQCIDRLDFTSVTRFADFVDMTKDKKRELELTAQLKKENPPFKFVAQYFHRMPHVTYFLAFAINVTLVLSVGFAQQNAWITDSAGDRQWNYESRVVPNETDPLYPGRPFYGQRLSEDSVDAGQRQRAQQDTAATPKGSGWYGSAGEYSGPMTFVQGFDTMQDSSSGQRATVYSWKTEGMDAEALVLAMGIVHLLLQMVCLWYRVLSCSQIVSEDMGKLEKEDMRGVRGGVVTSSRTQYSHRRDVRFPALLMEHFRGVAATGLFIGCWLLQLAGRYGGMIPVPFLWVNLLLLPAVMNSMHAMLLKWHPWSTHGLPKPELESGQQGSLWMLSSWQSMLGFVTDDNFSTRSVLSAVAYVYSLAMEVILYEGNLQFVASTVLAALAVGGFPFCYCILTLLVINTDKGMQTVLNAMSPETRSMLASTMLLLVLVVYIFR